MNQKIKDIISYGLNVILIVALVMLYFTINTRIENTEEGAFDYCVTWGIYNREDLITIGYNFKDQVINYDWTITDSNELIFFDYDNFEEVERHDCTRLVKSKKVEFDSVKEELDNLI